MIEVCTGIKNGTDLNFITALCIVFWQRQILVMLSSINIIN